jgi:cytochrome c oxidase cbb3-type subunit III
MSSRCRVEFILLLGAVSLLIACERETREFHEAAPQDSGVSPTTFRAGAPSQPAPTDAAATIYERNAFHIGEGKRYYEWYNCYSCHAAGGGDIGPPLMDEQWRYGGEMEQIRASILEGRPNGMPSFRGLIPDQQVMQIAAYVRSMSGLVPRDAPPSRGDELHTGEAKTLIEPAPPRDVAPSPQP